MSNNNTPSSAAAVSDMDFGGNLDIKVGAPDAANAGEPKPLLAGEIAAMAHRICTEYRHVERVKYGFTEMHLLDFGWAIEKEVLARLATPTGVAADESTRAPDGWIAVSDRLPEPNAAVLVAGEFDRPGDWRIKAAFYEPTCGDVIVRMNGGWRVIGGSWKPSHWRPMPAPPSGERPSAPAEGSQQ